MKEKKMKKYTFIFLILTLLILVAKTSYAEFNLSDLSQNEMLLKQGETNLVLPGEYFEISIENQDNSKFSIDYDKSLIELTRDESLPSHQIYYFKAIAEDVSNTKIIVKSDKENSKALTYDVYISPADKIPLVTLRDIKDNPDKYINKFVRLNARFLGWSRPVNTNEIWGTLVTKSDTVIEDNTGAAFISGTNFMYKTNYAVEFIVKVKPNEKDGFEIKLVKLLK